MRKTRISSDRVKTAGPTAVELHRRQRQVREKVGVPVGTAFAIFQGVPVRGKELYLLLYSQVVFCDLVEAFEHLVVRKKAAIGAPQATAKALDDPDDDPRFQ